jgi:hypothetical protein
MKTVLAVISAPSMAANIVQAMAIQAHQPDIVVLLQTRISGQNQNLENQIFLEAWLEGSDSLLTKYPNIDKPFKFPYTAPSGYISKGNSKPPSLVKIGVEPSKLTSTLFEIKSQFADARFVFDLLPGAKMIKTGVLIDSKLNNWNLSYTLEDGKVMYFEKGGIQTKEGMFLSIIDRCWLAGIPVYVSETKQSIKSKEEFYTSINECIYIEPFSDKEQEMIDNRKKKPEGMDRRKNDRPINMMNDEFISRFKLTGGTVSDLRPKEMHLQGKEGNEWHFECYDNTFPNGVPMEMLMANEINKGWNVDELYQGISLIYPTPEQRDRSYRNLLERQFEEFSQNPDSEHSSQPFKKRCESIDASLSTSLEGICTAEYKKLNSISKPEEALKYIRICEIDALTLDSFGVSSFDSKQILRKFNEYQSSMQRPSFLFNPKKTHYYVISSSSPIKLFAEYPVIHLSKIRKGRDVLNEKNKHQWQPSPHDIQTLSQDWKTAVSHFLKNLPSMTSFKKNQFEKIIEVKVGVAWDVLSSHLFSKQISFIDAVQQDIAMTIEQQKIFIEVLININKQINESSKAKITQLSSRYSTLKRQHKAEMKKLIKENALELQPMKGQNKNAKNTKIISIIDLRKRLESVSGLTQDYRTFTKNLREEGYRTKGIQKKIAEAIEGTKLIFNPNGEIMITNQNSEL